MPEKPVAGIDVSKDFSDMCIISPENEVFQTVHIFHDAASLQRSLTALAAAEHEFGERPVIVMESTAHYHRIIAQFLQVAGYDVLVINPMQSGSMKNINIRKVKSDKSDAHRLALLYRLKTFFHLHLGVYDAPLKSKKERRGCICCPHALSKISLIVSVFTLC